MNVLLKKSVTLEPVKQYIAKLIELLRSVRNRTNMSAIHCQVDGMNLEKVFFESPFDQRYRAIISPNRVTLSYLTSLGSIKIMTRSAKFSRKTFAYFHLEKKTIKLCTTIFWKNKFPCTVKYVFKIIIFRDRFGL